jgi:GAF domain/Histidine kinase-like ATPase domain
VGGPSPVGAPAWGPGRQSEPPLPGPSSPVADHEGADDNDSSDEVAALRLAPELRSVGRARARLTEVARGWGIEEDVIDDARVVISELMSNGVLHARTELQVVMARRGEGLRLEVHDASSVPVLPPFERPDGAASLLDEAEPDGAPELAAPAATGRGLSMVSALAHTWGWFPDAAGGKVVWAELGLAPPLGVVPGTEARDRPGYSLRPVRLIAVPLRLLKASEDHFDDLLRELQMANLAAPGGPGWAPQVQVPRPSAEVGGPTGGQAGPDGQVGPEGQVRLGPPAGDRAQAQAEAGRSAVVALAPMAEHLKMRLARMREPARRAIWEAARRGDRLVDLNLLADAGIPRALETMEHLLSRSAMAARRGYLLTEPPAPETVSWRRWLRRELEVQIGGKAPRACPFPVTPVYEEPVAPAREAQDAARHQAVSSLRALFGLPAAGDGSALGAATALGLADDAVMTGALRQTVQFAGASRAVLCLLAEDNETVRFGASVGFSPDVAEYWQASSVSADLPASEAIRTNRPVLFRTFAELDARYPVFLSTPSESDPALACIPVKGRGTAALGCLALGFAQARDFGGREVSFLDALASEISRFILDGRAAGSQGQAAQRSQDLEAAVAAVLSAPSKEEVMRQLVEVVVALVCDGASVHLVSPGGVVRYLMTRHRDPDRLAAAVALLQKRQRQQSARGSDDMLVECARTGKPSVVQLLSDEAITAGALDDEDIALLRRVSIGSIGVMAVRSGQAIVAVLSFANNAGRFITDDDMSALSRLTGAAGQSLACLGF